jgi:hypothetical protein
MENVLQQSIGDGKRKPLFLQLPCAPYTAMKLFFLPIYDEPFILEENEERGSDDVKQRRVL